MNIINEISQLNNDINKYLLDQHQNSLTNAIQSASTGLEMLSNLYEVYENILEDSNQKLPYLFRKKIAIILKEINTIFTSP